MAYENLKAAIKQVIKQNGNQEITGNLLQSTLLNIVNTLGADYKFLGFATPSTVPPTSEEGRLLYFTTGHGDRYTNFPTSASGTYITLEYGIYALTREANSKYWRSDVVVPIAQELGTALDKIMSQKAVKTELDKKIDKTSIVQETGTSETVVMSQKCVNDIFKDIKLATQQQFSKLDRETKSLVYSLSTHGINVVSQSLIDGIRSSSGITPSALYAHTEPILVKKGSTLFVFTKASSGVAVIGISNFEGSTFTTKVVGANTEVIDTYQYTAEEDTYIICNGYKDSLYILIDTHSLEIEISNSTKYESIKDMCGVANNGNMFTKNEYYNLSNNQYVNNSNYCTTDYIEYRKGDFLFVENGVSSVFIGAVVCFDEDENIIGDLKPKTNVVSNIYTDIFTAKEFPDKTAKIRITTKSETKEIAGFTTLSFNKLLSYFKAVDNKLSNINNNIVGSYPHEKIFSISNTYISTTDGTEKANAGYSCTDYIEITPKVCIKVENCSSSIYIASLACYSDTTAESFLGNIEPKTPVLVNVYSDIFYYDDLIEGTKYIRVTCSNANKAKANVLVYSIQKIIDDNNYLNSILKEISLVGKNIVVFGDSIADFKANIVGGDNKGIVEHLKELSGAKNVYRVAVGGSMICSRNKITKPLNEGNIRTPHDMVNLVNAVITGDWESVDEATEKLIEKGDDNSAEIATLKSINWEEVDIIIIFAGTNDWGRSIELGEVNSSSIYETCGALKNIVSNLSKKCPKGKIYYFSPIVRYWDFTTVSLECDRSDNNWGDNATNRKNITLEQQANKLIECALHNKINCCDTYHTLGWNRDNFGTFFPDYDNTHPYMGLKDIAKKMIKFISSN